jgi:hypothetical protein
MEVDDRQGLTVADGGEGSPQTHGPGTYIWSWERRGQLFETIMVDQTNAQRKRGLEGYVATGESEFTRAAAGRYVDGILQARPKPLGVNHRQDLIQEYAASVRWFEAELRCETNKARRDRLKATLEIKRRRLTELRQLVGEVQ